MKKHISHMGSVFLVGVLIILTKFFVVQGIFHTSDEAVVVGAATPSTTAKSQVVNLNQKVESVLQARRLAQTSATSTSSLFDKNGQLRVLLIGLDKRVGQTAGHCDVIQFFSIDQKKQTVLITAVPRGTYSPLPRGKGVTSTDYYVSNACGLAGLEYGIQQIEKIAGIKADYIVVVGFSETLGILRTLKLPTTETLQWLRRRRTYAVGEPQRARNHSTFLKQLMTQYLPKEKSFWDKTFRHIVYKTVQTDLSFEHANALADALAQMDFSKHPERITLAMKPAHAVKDIPYTPEHLDVTATETQEQVQKKLLTAIEQKKNNKEFITWAFENDVWLQIEDPVKRESVHYDFLERVVTSTSEKEKRQELIADYILEMEYLEHSEWAQKGKQLLAQEVGEKPFP